MKLGERARAMAHAEALADDWRAQIAAAKAEAETLRARVAALEPPPEPAEGGGDERWL
jgi:hypothetical protein